MSMFSRQAAPGAKTARPGAKGDYHLIDNEEVAIEGKRYLARVWACRDKEMVIAVVSGHPEDKSSPSWVTTKLATEVYNRFIARAKPHLNQVPFIYAEVVDHESFGRRYFLVAMRRLEKGDQHVFFDPTFNRVPVTTITALIGDGYGEFL
jgi:hypothetical protein